MLTLPELQVLMPLIDAGIRATGLQLFQNGGGVTAQGLLDKLQAMADEATANHKAEQIAALKAAFAAEMKEAADGENQHHD